MSRLHNTKKTNGRATGFDPKKVESYSQLFGALLGGGNDNDDYGNYDDDDGSDDDFEVYTDEYGRNHFVPTTSSVYTKRNTNRTVNNNNKDRLHNVGAVLPSTNKRTQPFGRAPLFGSGNRYGYNNNNNKNSRYNYANGEDDDEDDDEEEEEEEVKEETDDDDDDDEEGDSNGGNDLPNHTLGYGKSKSSASSNLSVKQRYVPPYKNMTEYYERIKNMNANATNKKKVATNAKTISKYGHNSDIFNKKDPLCGCGYSNTNQNARASPYGNKNGGKPYYSDVVIKKLQRASSLGTISPGLGNGNGKSKGLDYCSPYSAYNGNTKRNTGNGNGNGSNKKKTNNNSSNKASYCGSYGNIYDSYNQPSKRKTKINTNGSGKASRYNSNYCGY